MGSHVRFLSVLLIEEEVGEGGNEGVLPEVGKVCVGGESGDAVDVAFVGFTLVDEPGPPLA